MLVNIKMSEKLRRKSTWLHWQEWVTFWKFVTCWMVVKKKKREVKCSNICVGRGESQTYTVNQVDRQRRNVSVEKVECGWGWGWFSGQTSLCNVECCRRRSQCFFSLGVDICRCLPPDRSWHKVNDPKVDWSGD